MNFVSSALESCHESLNPKYARQKKACQAGLETLKLVSAAILVSSAVTTFFALGNPFSLPIIFISLPLCYATYNSYQMLGNLQDIMDNPKKFQYGWGLVPEFNHAKIVSKIREKTIFIDWIPIEEFIKTISLNKK